MGEVLWGIRMRTLLRTLSWGLTLGFLLILCSTPGARGQSEFLCTDVTAIPVAECQALVALYDSTNGAGWVFNNYWLVDLNPDEWYGVTVESGVVSQLILPENGLLGVIPPDLRSLTGLVHLDLSSNQLSGEIPLALGSLSNLAYLYLDHNQLSGAILGELGDLTSLVHLYLSDNQLSGAIPPQLGNLTNLTYLDLGSNQLSGEIPTELGNLSILAHLYLNSNQLNGEIPTELGTLNHLERLYLYDNLLTGSIPTSLGNLTLMWNLWLSGNQLSGPIPAELGQLSGLVWLRLANNQLSGNIPEELGALTGLWQLSLGGNQLSGEIPAALGNLTDLLILSLAGNQLDGSIPPELGLLTNLYELDLSSNQLGGVIPQELSDLIYLEILLLNNNQLTGDIPDIANLTCLLLPGELDGGDGLDLDYNALTVPADYPNLTNQLHEFLSQYDPNWHTLQAFEQVIGIDGGVLTALDSRTSFLVPEGALSGDTTFTFTPLPAPAYDPGVLVDANHSFQLTAEDASGLPVTFGRPLTVSLTYTDTDVLSLSEASLALFYWDSAATTWQDAAATCPDGAYTRDLLANSLTLPLCHLSDFSVFGLPVQPTFLPLIVRRAGASILP